VNSDFDLEISREGTVSVKHDGRGAYFGSEDLIPLWVADMDFAGPAAVTQALQKRAAHPIYGYSFCPDSLFEALIGWLQKRHGWEVRKEWIVLSPGVVPSLHAVVLALTQPEEAVIVQPPVYPPFFTAVTLPGRRLMLNPLRLHQGRYTIDFDHLERCAAAGARLLLLCTPHNPVGRVWNPEELAEILRLADRHDMTVLADEIHHDLVYPGNRHYPLATLTDTPERIVTAVAPSKTFNIPGLGLSALIVPDPERRRAIRKLFDLFHGTPSNPFSIVAFEAAYREGEEWLDRLLRYLAEARDFSIEFLRRHAPEIGVTPPEGTYLLWLDCRELHMTDSELRSFFVHEARVGLNPGLLFGEAGSGFMRLNLGSPQRVIATALDRIATALRHRHPPRNPGSGRGPCGAHALT
jgi:cystathionine beta-lyase